MNEYSLVTKQFNFLNDKIFRKWNELEQKIQSHIYTHK
jgi:hypothetical protein